MKRTNALPKEYNLQNKVDEIVDWYFEEFCKDKYTEVGQNLVAEEYKDFIEKMAVWYEMRFPTFEIAEKVKDNCFQNQPGLKNFSYESFLTTLSSRDFYLSEGYELNNGFIPLYPSIPANLKFTDGIVTEAYDEGHFENKKLKMDISKLIGKRISEVKLILLLNGYKNTELEVLTNHIHMINNRKLLKNKTLEAVLYRIIDRDTCRVGLRRALLFATEFSLDKSEPLKYITDLSDPKYNDLINEYFEVSSKDDFNCILNYSYVKYGLEKPVIESFANIIKIANTGASKQSSYKVLIKKKKSN